jgi:hypothetical protein
VATADGSSDSRHAHNGPKTPRAWKARIAEGPQPVVAHPNLTS